MPIRTTPPLDVVVIDDRLTSRNALAACFGEQSMIRTVHEVDSSLAAIALLAAPNVAEVDGDLLVVLALDSVPDMAIELIGRFRSHWPRATMVILGEPGQGELLTRAIEAGADGMIRRESSPTRIRTAALRAVDGAVHIDPDLALSMMRSSPGQRPDGQRLIRIRASLASRETSILHGLARGQTEDELAATMVSDVETIQIHLANALRKLGVTSRAAAVLFAIRHGFIPLQERSIRQQPEPWADGS